MKPLLLFDASAFLNLVLKRGEGAFGLIVDGSLLDLTLYEVGNTVWKLASLRKRLSIEEAEDLLALAEKLATRARMIAHSGLSFAEAIRIAVNENVTFYDAVYVEAARASGMVLVTDDGLLRRVASKYVEVKGSEEL